MPIGPSGNELDHGRSHGSLRLRIYSSRSKIWNERSQWRALRVLEVRIDDLERARKR